MSRLLLRVAATGPGGVFSRPKAVAAGKRGPQRCSKTLSRPSSSYFAAVVLNQAAEPFLAHHVSRVGRWSFGRRGRPARRPVAQRLVRPGLVIVAQKLG